LLDARDPFTDFDELVHLLLVVAEDDADLHVVEQLGDFIGHGGLVDGRRYGPDRLGANGDEKHFRNVVADQDGIASF
jgi:hypothetical protein